MTDHRAMPSSELLGTGVAALVRPLVTTVWASPTSPRPVDRDVVADRPDAKVWLAALDAHPGDDRSGDGRLGLHGRIVTQLTRGEPVLVVGRDPGGAWTEVRAPWQPSPEDDLGYPGWVPTAHLEPAAEVPGAPSPAETAEDGAAAVIDLARTHIGLTYLWGGVSPLGFDCSGLVHYAWRQVGVVVARDAYAQSDTAAPVAVDEVRPGDLYFFAHPGRRIHHVGIVTTPGRMVHASETGGALVEEDLPPERLATLVSAGRLPLPPRSGELR